MQDISSRLKRTALFYRFRFAARYPSHEASKWLDHSKEHSHDIDDLHSPDGDFHHGFNSGVLAAARMFKEQADVVHPVSNVSLFL